MSQGQEQQSSSEVAEPEIVDSVSPGGRLKKARLSRGLSVDDVSTRLKLGADKIESFERGDIAGIATPVFVAGYLRAYARLLELPEDEVLADFEVLPDVVSQGVASGEVASKSDDVIYAEMTSLSGKSSISLFGKSKSVLMPVLMSILVIAAVYFALLNDESDDNHQVDSARSSEPENTLRPSVDEPVENMRVAPSVGSAVVKDESAEGEAPVGGAEEELVPAGNLEQSGTEKIEIEAEVFHQSELALVFNGDSWVEVTDARGERLIYRLAKAGMSLTVMGVAPFSAQLGYVPGVEIFYNGAPYDLSHFAGRRSARFSIGNVSDQMSDG